MLRCVAGQSRAAAPSGLGRGEPEKQISITHISALGYLIGEKLVNFVRAAEQHPEFARKLPNFIAEIKRIFEPWEIREYLVNIRLVGAFGHVCTDDEVEVFRAAGAIDEDPVRGAEDVLIVKRIKELLLV